MGTKFRILQAIIILIAFGPVKAADFYWVNGSGNWSAHTQHWATTSGGQVFHTRIPGMFDNVIFDSLSFSLPGDTVILDSTSLACKNFITAYVNNSPVFKSIAGSPLRIYGSLKLSSNIQWNVHVPLELCSQGTDSLLFNGVHIVNMLFNGTGSWHLTDSLSAGTLSMKRGTLISGGNTIVCSNFLANDSNYTSHVNIDSSNVYTSVFSLHGPFVTFSGLGSSINSLLFSSKIAGSFHFVKTGSFYSGNSQFKRIIINPNGEFYGGNNLIDSLTCDSNITIASMGGPDYFKNVLLHSSVNIFCDVIIDTLNFKGISNHLLLKNGSTLNVTSDFNFNGSCTGLSTIMSDVAGVQANINILDSLVNMEYVFVKDIALAGNSINPLFSYDGGNNSGWTINSTPIRTLYWVGGSGNWNDTSHWASVSGGIAGNCPPSPMDDIVFDTASFDTTWIHISSTSPVVFANSINWLYASGSDTLQLNKLSMMGSIHLLNNITVDVNIINLFSSGQNNEIMLSGNSINNISFTGSGEYILADDIHTKNMYVNNGFLNTDGFNISGSYLEIKAVSSGLADFDTSHLTFNAVFIPVIQIPFSLDLDSCILNTNYLADSSGHQYNKVNFSNGNIYTSTSSFKDLSFTGDADVRGNDNYFQRAYFGSNLSLRGENNIGGNIMINGNTGIYGNITTDTLKFLKPGSVITLASGKIQNVQNYLSLSGTCTRISTLKSTIPGVSASLNCYGQTVNTSNLVIRDINSSGTVFNATESFNAGNVLGWSITTNPPRTLYWVGGTGSWGDSLHWSLSSGGAGNSCLPMPNDDVVFDDLSFSATSEMVTLDLPEMYCHNMDWSNIITSPHTSGNSNSNNMNIYGSLWLSNLMTWTADVGMMLCSAGPSLIDLNGQYLQGVQLNGSGTYTLVDTFAASYLTINMGGFDSDGYPVISNLYAYSDLPCSLDLDTSEVTANDIFFNSYNLTVDADSSIINCTKLAGSHIAFNNVKTKVMYSSYNKFNTLLLKDGALTEGAYNKYNYLVTLGNGEMKSVNDSALHFTVKKDFLINTMQMDTLLLDNAGGTLTLKQGAILKVDSSLMVNSSSSFPITINTYDGAGSSIYNDSSIFCIDHVVLDKITAAGTGLFFAGINSVDAGNNNGWQFTSCVLPQSDVWPGDANYDGIANNFDILNLGLAYGHSGTVRLNADTSWTAQPALDWNTQFIDSTNLKHADCDGNGIVDMADTLAVFVNYGMMHQLRITNVTQTGPELFFDAPSVVNAGSLVSVPLFFGTNNLPVSNAYGLAFTVNYSGASPAPGNSLTYGGWFVYINYMKLEKHISSNSIDVALTRIDHIDAGGNGVIGFLNLLIDSANSRLFEVSISNIRVVNSAGNIIPVQTKSDSAQVVGITKTGISSNVQVYPNPVREKLYVNGNMDSEFSYQVIDATGKILMSEDGNVLESGFYISASTLQPGIYILKLFDRKSVQIFKFVKN